MAQDRGPDTDHYTAVVSLTRTKLVKDPAQGSTSFRGEAPSPKRVVSQISNLTIRASSIERLTEKVIAHLQLIEDDTNGG